LPFLKRSFARTSVEAGNCWTVTIENFFKKVVDKKTWSGIFTTKSMEMVGFINEDVN